MSLWVTDNGKGTLVVYGTLHKAMEQATGGVLNWFSNFFLRAKSWQVFVLVWGAYFVGQIAIVSSLPERTGPFANPLKVGLFSEAAMFPFIVCFMGRLWSVGSFLFSISEPKFKLNIHFFRFAIIFPSLYLLTALPFFLSSNSPMEEIILPLHLFALFCFFYGFYFVSKSLVAVERGEAVTRHDYTITLLLILFSLIGIWLIQPRINRLYARGHA